MAWIRIQHTGTFLALLAVAGTRNGNSVLSFRSGALLTRGRPFSSTVSLQMSSSADKKRVLVPIADGSEEIETTCITDTLTRFGAAVTVASVKDGGNALICTMSRGIKIVADIGIHEAALQEWDLVALPGGMPGAENLRDSVALQQILRQQRSAGKMYGAVCAAPAVVLASLDLVDEGAAATCYPAPSFRQLLKNPSDDAVVVSGTMTTSQGPGTALHFALKLGENLYGKEKRDQIAKQLLLE